MATVSKIPLSNSTDYRPIAVTGTAASGSLIHTCSTALTAADQGDELVLYMHNPTTGDATLSMLWGGTGATEDLVEVIIPAGDTILGVPGMMIRNGLSVRCGATVAEKLNVAGYAIRAS